jgi:hypothetical protein
MVERAGPNALIVSSVGIVTVSEDCEFALLNYDSSRYGARWIIQSNRSS